MKLGRLLLPIILLSPAGCFVGYGVRNTTSSPLDAIQECAFRFRVRLLAREAWRKVRNEEAKSYSADYAKGFEDGFVDYIDAGGNGEPPAAACPHRRRLLLRTDEGPEKIEDWYEGFRHGASVARETGLRELAIMPVSLPALTPTEPYPARVIVPDPFVAPAPAPDVPDPVVVPAPAAPPDQAFVPVPEAKLKIFTGRSDLMAAPSPSGFRIYAQ